MKSAAVVKEWNVGDVIKNSDAMAGQTITHMSGKQKYIWKECRIVEKSGKIQGTNINTYEVIDDKGRRFTLDDEDLQEITANKDFSYKEKIVQVASTLALEEMYVGKDILDNLTAVGKKEKTIDDCIRELDEIYGR